MDETVKKAQPEIRRNSERLDDLEAHQANVVKTLDDTSNQVQDNVKEMATLKQMTGNQNNNLGDIEDSLKQSEDQIKHIDDTIDGVHRTVAIFEGRLIEDKLKQCEHQIKHIDQNLTDIQQDLDNKLIEKDKK